MLAQINSTVGDFKGNFEKIRRVLADSGDADLVVFPECSLSGYPPQDLLDYKRFAETSEWYANQLVEAEPKKSFIFGSVEKNVEMGRPYRNVAIFSSHGKIIGKYFKRLLPSYDVFDEDRFFEAGRSALIVPFQGEKIAITICEDIWSEAVGTFLHNRYQQNPLEDSKNATLHINLSASPFEYAKVKAKREMLERIVSRYKIPFLYVNSVGANDSLIFDGRTYAWDAEGKLLAEGKAFQEDLIKIDLKSESKSLSYSENSDIKNIYDALILGIQDYCRKQNFSSVVLGLSGGIDSSVVACLAGDALGADNVFGVLLPSRFTSSHSNEDAIALAKATQSPVHILAIEEVFQACLRTLSKTFEGCEPNVTEENLQSRTRGILLMAISNKFGNLLLTTGNKSELAVGYCTLYGDMCGGLAPISDLYKTQVYELGREANRRAKRIPERVFEKAPTAELRENQFDQDTLPPYERLDKILKALLEDFSSPEDLANQGFDLAEVQKISQWLNQTEYKRFQMPLGLKVSSKAFGIGRRLPLVSRFS
ncbi:MAG: NAD+ synthase [Deltaproteobacteria bacterium]|nr:NAD+ synthase [Deltaproteobacteria bacterium]